MKSIFIAGAALFMALSLADCTLLESLIPEEELADSARTQEIYQAAYDRILSTYYAAQDTPAFEFFQKSRIQSFLKMWVLEETGDVEDPRWILESFAQIEILDHDFEASRPDEALYYCVFTDGGEQSGYIIVSYDPEGPAMGNWSVRQTWERIYDLREHGQQIFEMLQKTDIDMETVTASRVYFYDRDKRRADQVVRFTDAKGDNYLYYFGDESYMIEKFEK